MEGNPPRSASFTSAPPEVLLQIIKLVPDLRSLHSLALAVPVVYRLWKDYGAEILRAVTSNRITITPQLRDLIWLVTLLRSAEVPVWTLDTFLEAFAHRTMRTREPPVWPCTVPVPTSCPFSVLSTASRIHDLTQSCLEHYLERLREVQPRLRRPADKSFNYRAPYGPNELMVPGWRRHTDEVSYDTPYMATASWVEEQVVIRAFWRLQLLYDFRHAAHGSRLAGWSRSDVDRIASLQLEQMFRPMDPLMTQYHEIVSVHEYLQHCNDVSCLVDSRPTKGINLRIGPTDIPGDDWCIVPWKGPTRPLHYVPEGLYNRSTLHITQTLIYFEDSPIKGVSFALFRRLGFAFWDAHRLAALGLAGAPLKTGQRCGPVTSSPWHYWYSWRSLLNPADIAEVEMRLAAEEEQARKRHEEWYAAFSSKDN